VSYRIQAEAPLLRQDIVADDGIPGKSDEPGLQAGYETRQGGSPHHTHLKVHHFWLLYKASLGKRHNWTLNAAAVKQERIKEQHEKQQVSA